MGFVVRQKLALGQRLQERAQTRLLASSGIARARVLLKNSSGLEPGPDSFKDPWYREEIFRDVQTPGGYWSVGHRVFDSQSRELKFVYGLVDEESKININKADLPALQRLFKVVFDWADFEAEELASAIIDWRDSDSGVLALGAEDPYYQSLADPYHCKDAPFEILEELLLVRGVTVKIYDILKCFVTIYGSGVVNVNTAPFEALLALGIDEKVVEKIFSFRAGKDKEDRTGDDNIFAQQGEIVSRLSQFVPMTSEEVANLSNVVSAGLLGTNSSYFSATSIGFLRMRGDASGTEMKSKGLERRVETILRRTWSQENGFSVFPVAYQS